MKINNITITNFKSLYGTRTIDFSDIQGLVKLSGVVGSGKTVLGESILWGLYGTIKEQNNPTLISWKEKEMEIDLELQSGGKEIVIKRNTHKPLEVYIDGKLLIATNKNDTQNILENEYYDVPRLAIEKMCIVSFNLFKSIAKMNPSDTKLFLDDIFGFKTFTEYNNVVVSERKEQSLEQIRLQAKVDETSKQIGYLETTKEQRQSELSSNIDVDKVNSEMSKLKSKMDIITENVKSKKSEIDTKIADEQIVIDDNKTKIDDINSKKHDIQLVINEYTVLGKQEKEWCKKFESGKCPTCGHEIDDSLITEHKKKMSEYAKKIYAEQDKIKAFDEQIADINKLNSKSKEVISGYNADFSSYREEQLKEYNALNKEYNSLNSEIIKYQSALKTIDENYDQMIVEAKAKLKALNDDLTKSSVEIGEWNEMNDLFTKTLRYNLLNTLIPQINNSIRFYVNKFEQPYNIEFDQEFKSHIYAFEMDDEIKYTSLSTGQKKSLDTAIIFGILQNVISSVDFNILFLDELFTNMDANTRNNMLQVLKETNTTNRTIFVINHSEMADDWFAHKIRVTLQNKKLTTKKGSFVVKNTNYDKIF